MSRIDNFLAAIEDDAEIARSFRYREALPERDAAFAELDPPLPQAILNALQRDGIRRLFTHQVAAVEAVRRGESVVVVTPTASGKTLTFSLPILEAMLAEPATSALLIYPLKALEQDQRGKLVHWQAALAGTLPFSVEIYDGDTPAAKRAKIKRSPPNFLITNPDMLHQGLLAYHTGWEQLLKRLRYVVIDELHTYRGVFGSHILQVLARLQRLLSYHRVKPQFICLSATIANPRALAESLMHRDFTVVSESGAPLAAKDFVMLSTQSSTTSLVAKLFVKAIDAGLKTLVFSKARVQTEVVHRIVLDTRPDLAPRISSYRAGFLSEERRDIERRLASGELTGVISTSALELGIDIGGLDLCILAGYPGSMMSFWQRAGRVGRRDEHSAVIMIAGYDALDQYLVSRPEQFLHRPFEAALVNDANEEILRAHLPAAAAEIPLMADDPFIDVTRYQDVLADLEREGALVRSASGKQWFPGGPRPHAAVNLRNIGGTFDIMQNGLKRPVGDISGGAVFRECHTGAVYLHRGEPYLVEELDIERRRVVVRPTTSTIYTMARSDKQTEILDDREQKVVHGFVAHRGKVKVTETYHSFERRRIYTQELLSVEPLDLPPQSYVTDSLWLQLPADLESILAAEELHFMGGIHACEHAAISLIPLFALCDRNDVGGISFMKHPQLPEGAVFFYDGYPGGAGIANFTFSILADLLVRTRELILNCSCEAGCPTCIQSPKCGSGNKPLDKRAAVRVLDVLLDRERTVLPEAAAVRVAQPVSETAEVPWQAVNLPADKRVLVFDLETQLSADDVGGWNAIRFMRLAIGVVWDSKTNRMSAYGESEVEALIAHLQSADLVVGYNLKRFDYEVLRGYTFADLQALPTLDLLLEVQDSLGNRLKLDTLTRATLGAQKTADGLQSLEWFKEGRLDLVTEYCIHDVELTRDLLLFALGHGYVLYERKDFGTVRIPLRLDPRNFMDSVESVS
ncbi:DEAD/DEAH box helicase [candidate division KSB1 bacterium]|nr:DEAD/DEAH box helicase [candidate division KSB1 bacterium]